jgi:hypothetical protein
LADGLADLPHHRLELLCEHLRLLVLVPIHPARLRGRDLPQMGLNMNGRSGGT